MFRKLILSTSVIALLGSAAFAGGVVETTPDVVIAANQGSSSQPGLLVPLLLLVIVAAAVASGNGDNNDGGGQMASDRRIKTDVDWVGMERGLPVYRFRYIGSPTRFEGVMAQDVLAMMPEAVAIRSNGLMAVDYAKLGMKMKVIH